MTTLVITGTDTDIGKTVVTAAFAAIAVARGLRVVVIKPAQTGVLEGEPGDCDEITRLSGIEHAYELSRYAAALAPEAAARLAGGEGISMAQILAGVGASPPHDILLVEGAGGPLVRFNAGGMTILDVAKELNARALLVTRAGLGTLNHTALCCEAIARREISCAGLVIGSWPAKPDIAARANLDDFTTYTGQQVIGRIPEGAGRLTPSVFASEAQTWIGVEEIA